MPFFPFTRPDQPAIPQGLATRAYVDSQLHWEVVFDHVSAGIGNTETFFFDAITFVDHSFLVLEIDISSAVGGFDLFMTINDNTGAIYFFDGWAIAAGVESLIDLNAQNELTLIPNAAITAVNETAFGVFKIGLMDGGNQRPNMFSQVVSGQGLSWAGGSVMVTPITEISRIDIFTSANSWRSGTRFTCYKVPRT